MALKTIHSHLEKVSRVAAITGGIGIMFISFMITVDVILRKFFGTTLGGASEIAGMVFAVATAIAYPFVLLDRAHIRIDVLYSRLSRRMRAFLDFAATAAVLVFAWMLTSSVWDLLQNSWSRGSRSVGVIQAPLWVPQSIWVLGFALFTLTAIFLCIYAIVGIVRGDWASVNTVAGVPSIEETIEEETHIDVDLSDVPSASNDEEDPR